MAASYPEDFRDSRTGSKHHYDWHNTILLTIPRPALGVFIHTDSSRSIFIKIPNILVLTFGLVLKLCLVRGQEKVRPKTCTHLLPPRVQTLYVLTQGLLLMDIGCPDSREWPFAHQRHYNSPVLSPGVSKIIGRGSECFIGLIDEPKVLKHPRIAGDNTSIEVEAQLLAVLGSYPRIVNSYGLSEHGLLLQYAPNGNLSEYIRSAPRFQNGYFRTDDHACSEITTKCRRQLYESAEDVIFDISELQTSKGVGEEHENN